MTQYFAVIDKEGLSRRSKWASDFVFYGTAKQAVEEVARITGTTSADVQDAVNVYKVKKSPEFVDVQDTKLSTKFANAKEGTKAQVAAFIERHDIPTDKAAALVKLEEIKKVAIAEGSETAVAIAGTLMMTYKMGLKDPKGLAQTAKKGALAKGKQVKTRLLGLFSDMTTDAKGVQGQIEADAFKTVGEMTHSLIGANPDGLKQEDGTRLIRAAYLLFDGNAEAISVKKLQQIATAKPRAKKGAAPKA